VAYLRKYYWDACVWIDLITQSNADRFRRCQNVFSQAQKGEVELWTSSITLTEVYKRKCDGDLTSMPEDQDDEFESFFESGLVKPILLDLQVAKVARRLCRKHPILRKPQDAVYVASCIVSNIDELHTFDIQDLIRLDGQILLKNSTPLKISEPPAPLPKLFDP